MKRYRMVDAKHGELRAAFGRDDCGNIGLQYAWGGAGAGKPDARVLSTAFEGVDVFDGTTLVKELEKRGYDITTLRFSIKQKSGDA